MNKNIVLLKNISEWKIKLYVVIDSLSRSGTTLLASTLGNAPEVISFRGGSHEHVSCYSKLFRWPDTLITSKPAEQVKIVNKSGLVHRLGFDLLNGQTLYLDSNKLLDFTLSKIEARNQFNKLERKLITNLIRKYRSKIHNTDDVDKFYAEILAAANCDILLQRWNNAISYSNVWMKRPRHFWINLIRNPVHSAISRKIAFGTSYRKSLKFELEYAEKRAYFAPHRHFFFTHYEDLLSHPEKFFEKVSLFLEQELNINFGKLSGTDGKPLRSESSNITSQRRKGVKLDYISKEPLSAYDDHSDLKIVKNLYCQELSQYEELKRYF